jgi:hypothetical protein
LDPIKRRNVAFGDLAVAFADLAVAFGGDVARF